MAKPKLPHSLESEQGVLACCLAEEDGSLLDEALELGLKPSDFFAPKHAEIFDHLLQMRLDNQPLHEISLLEYLRKSNSRIEIAEIYAIQERVEVAERHHVKAFTETVLENSRLRKLIRLGKEAIEQAQESNSVSVISAHINNSIIEINQVANEDSCIASATEVVWEDIKAMLNGTYSAYGLPFGIPPIDDKIPQGMEPGTVTVISGPTSCGKSQIALGTTLTHAIKHGRPCGYASFEMLSPQLAKRMLRVSSGVNIDRIRDGVATEKEIKAVMESKDKLAKTKILTDHRNRNITDLMTLCRQWKRKHDIQLLTIDYLQLLWPPNNKMGSVEAVAYNSRMVKALALDLQIPILLLSQVNREAIKKLEFSPARGLMVHDLIGGSAIECDADNIFLFWPKLGDADQSRTTDGSGTPYMQMVGQFGKAREGTRGQRFDFKFIEHKGRFQ